MARWDPDAEDRLRRAAVDLYRERGFENVSVAEISELAGLTRRTFFRYFADKREVLFAGVEHLPGAVRDAVRDAGPGLAPLQAALHALRAVGLVIVARVDHRHARERRRVIAASPELQERERSKLAVVTTALVEALQHRGVDPELALPVARVGVAILETAFTRWGEGDGAADFARSFDGVTREVTAQFTSSDVAPPQEADPAARRHG